MGACFFSENDIFNDFLLKLGRFPYSNSLLRRRTYMAKIQGWARFEGASFGVICKHNRKIRHTSAHIIVLNPSII